MKKISLITTLLVVLTLIGISNSSAQLLIRHDPGIQLGYNSYRFLSFGAGTSSPNNGQYALEFCSGCTVPGFNLWRPWPEPNSANYIFFVRQADNNIGIGTYGDASYALDVAGDVRCYSLTQTSDRRLKANINPLQGSLDKILKLKGVSYNYDFSFDRDPNSKDTNIIKRNTIESQAKITASKAPRFGLLAQDVQPILPEIVKTDEKGFLGVNYIDIIPLLIESIKEQQKQIESLQKALNYTSTTKVSSSSYLLQNVPNPFSEHTSIGYHIQQTIAPTQIAISIYDKNGNVYKTLAGNPTNGDWTVDMDCSQCETGLYIYTLQLDGIVVDTKMMIFAGSK